MKTFGWVATQRDPPERWDLRRCGWRICRGLESRRAECRHVLLLDTRGLQPEIRSALAAADRPAWRLLMIGVEDPAERARLLSSGVAEAMPAKIELSELEARARRVDDMLGMLPRWRAIGDLTLDLFHRDVRHAGRWLGLHPREFGLLWRLADTPGERVSRRQLLTDVWRLRHEPETNSVAVHVSRLRTKLATVGCADVLRTDSRGGYFLTGDGPFMLAARDPVDDGLDSHLLTDPFLAQSPAAADKGQ